MDQIFYKCGTQNIVDDGLKIKKLGSVDTAIAYKD